MNEPALKNWEKKFDERFPEYAKDIHLKTYLQEMLDKIFIENINPIN